MDITIPAIPAGILTLLSFFAPYAIALINHPSWPTGSKRVVSMAVSVALTLVATWLYYKLTGDEIPHWPVLLLLGIAISQAAYALLLKSSAEKVEGRYGLHK